MGAGEVWPDLLQVPHGIVQGRAFIARKLVPLTFSSRADTPLSAPLKHIICDMAWRPPEEGEIVDYR